MRGSQEQLVLQGERLQEIITPPKPAQESSQQQVIKKQLSGANAYYLNTDRRAAERRGVELPPNDLDVWWVLSPRSRLGVSTGACLGTYHCVCSPQSSRRAALRPCCAHRQPASKTGHISNAEYQKQRRIKELQGVIKKQQAHQVVQGRAPLVPPAEWRRNVQRARRNAYIMVRAAALTDSTQSLGTRTCELFCMHSLCRT